jgi:methylthioribose-1-phosphate isomerase
MARIGSIAAAPFVGNQFAALYLGETRVPTVPGPPVIANAGTDGDELFVSTTAPDNGGSAITAYNLYVNGSLVVTESLAENETVINAWGIEGVSVGPGDIVRVSATNGIGEGPLSNAVIAEDI